jgi:outer membrane protein insertion porin family
MYKLLIIIFLTFTFKLSAEVVQRLEVEGNKRISSETIKVYGEINLNENYSNFDVDRILQNLYKTNFFEDIQISLTNGILNISVKEYSVINSIDLVGEKSNAIKTKVLKLLSLQEKESFIKNKLATDLELLKKVYATIGFNFATIDAKIEKFDNNRINLIYFLSKGKKTNIRKINFTGDKKIKEKRLREVIVSEEKKFWKFLSRNTFLSATNIELDQRLLINYYKSLGYYDVQVLSDSAEISKDNFTTLTYTVNAGNRYKVTKVSTNVSEVLSKKEFLPLQKSFAKIVGRYYSPFTVKKLLDELDTIIADADLQFIEHSVNEILENDEIEIVVNIFEGSKKIVEKVNITGNTITEESVIRAELLLDEGDPFNALKLDQSIARIKARRLFSLVDKDITEGSSKNSKIINISVEEQATGEISAGAGIGTNGGSFAFDITENNWLGRGLNVSTNINVNKETFSGGVNITDPHYNFSGNSLYYFVNTVTNDKPDSGFKNNIVTTGLGTSFEQYRNIRLGPSLTFSHDSLDVKSSASDSLKKQKGSFSDLSFGYSVSLDNRDKVYAPTAGYISTFTQTLPIYADSPFMKNSYNFAQYQSFSEEAVGSFKFDISAINGLNDYDVRLNKRLGSRKIRGFEAGKIGPKDGKDFVGGNYAWSSNLGLGLPKLLPEATKTDVSLFLDFGNVWKVDYNPGIDDSNKIRSSTGVNLSWLSPVGPMNFILSQNISKAKTDITETFNFKLGTSF